MPTLPPLRERNDRRRQAQGLDTVCDFKSVAHAAIDSAELLSIVHVLVHRLIARDVNVEQPFHQTLDAIIEDISKAISGEESDANEFLEEKMEIYGCIDLNIESFVRAEIDYVFPDKYMSIKDYAVWNSETEPNDAVHRALNKYIFREKPKNISESDKERLKNILL